MSILEKVFKDDYEKVMRKLSRLVDEPMNQTDKMDKYEDMFEKYDLYPLDAGTNRVVYQHRKFPNVVFKIALDEQGTLDNGNENEKSDKHTYFPDSYDIDLDCNILVQERADKIDIELFNKDKTRKRVRDMLKELDDQGFLLIDLGADKHKNFGYRKKTDDLMIIDFGYVEYKSLGNFNCPHTRYPAKEGKKPKHCKGRLKYNKTFTRLVCSECENPFKVDVVLEGYTETKHEDHAGHKPTNFEPNRELKDFYKQFKGSRDRETLTQYVALSRPRQVIQPVIQNEGSVQAVKQMSSAKAKFLNKVKGQSTQLSPVRKQSSSCSNPNTVYASDDNDPDFDRPIVNTNIPSYTTYANKGIVIPDGQQPQVEYIQFHDEGCSDVNEVYESTESEVIRVPLQEVDTDVEMAAESNVFELLLEGRFHDAEQELEARGISKEQVDKVIEAYYFEKFPDMKQIIEEANRNFEVEQLKAEQDAAAEQQRLLHQVTEPIQVITETEAGDETHITIDIDNMGDKRPLVIAFKGDTVYYIDLAEHINRLDRDFVNKTKDSDIIITAMGCEPTTTFDGNYDNYYYDKE